MREKVEKLLGRPIPIDIDWAFQSCIVRGLNPEQTVEVLLKVEQSC